MDDESFRFLNEEKTKASIFVKGPVDEIEVRFEFYDGHACQIGPRRQWMPKRLRTGLSGGALWERAPLRTVLYSRRSAPSRFTPA